MNFLIIKSGLNISNKILKFLLSKLNLEDIKLKIVIKNSIQYYKSFLDLQNSQELK